MIVSYPLPAALPVDSSGRLIAVAPAATTSTSPTVIAGTDGTAIRTLKLNSDGTLSVSITGGATETTLGLLNAKITSVDTNSVIITTSALPTGASTEATLALIKAKTDNLDVALSTRAVTGLTDTQLRASAITIAGAVTANIGTLNGIATSAKQAALGVAGTASTDVLTIQGIASMVALKVDGSATTQPVSVAGSVAVTGPLTDTQLRATAVPVSGTVTANLGTLNGASTSALQTTGNTSLGSIDTKTPSLVTGRVPVDGSGVTQPVSGTLTANIGTSGSLALDTTLTGGTQRTKLTDGTNNATVKAASTAAVASDTAIVVAISPNNSLTVANASVGATGSTAPASASLTGANVTTAAPSLTNNTLAALSLTTSGSLRTDGSGSTQPVSGTVTANAGTGTMAVSAASLPLPSGAATSSNQTTLGSQTTKLNDGTNTATIKAASTAALATDTAIVVAISPNNSLTVGNASVGATGATTPTSAGLAGGAATTAAPTLTTGQMSGLSLNLAGGLRVDGSGVTQPVSGSVTANIGTSGSLALDATLTGGTQRTKLTDGTNNAAVKAASTAAVAADPALVVAISPNNTVPVSAASLPLPTGAATETSLAKLTLAQGSTTSGQTGSLHLGAVTTAAPAYTTGQTSPISLTATGLLRTDGSGATQPVSGTVTANQGGTWNVTNVSGTVSLPTGASTETTLAAASAKLPATLGQKTSAASLAVVIASDQSSVPVSGTITANIGTSGSLALDATTTKLTIAQSAALGTNTQAMVGGSVTTAAPTYTTGNVNPLSLTTAGALRTDSSGSTQPVSGTVTSNIGTTNGLALDATLTGGTQRSKITDGTTNVSVKAASTAAVAGDTALVVAISPNNPITVSNPSVGSTGATTPTSATLAGGAATTAAPSLTTGQMTGLSLNLAGGLRVDGSGVTQPVSGSVSVTGSVAVTGPLTDTQIRATPLPVSGTVTATNASVNTTGSAPPASATYAGGSVTTASPSYTTGQMSALSLTTVGALRVDGSSTTQPVSGTVAVSGSVAVTGPLTDTQLRASAVPVSGTVTANIGTTNGLALDATLTGGTQRTKLTDGTTNTAVKAASTAAVAVDPALVVAISPNNSVAITAAALPLPSGAATETTLSSLNSKVTAVNTGAVVVSSSALPTGASTETTLAAVSGKLPATLGQKTSAASMAVTIASDQSTIAVTGPLTDTQIRATALPISGSVTANIGTTNGLALDATLTGGTQRTKLTDGTTNTAVKAASTAAVAADPALVVAISPNNTVGVTGTVAVSGSVVVTGPLTDTQLRASAVPVSAASLPLPTGAATETTLAAVSGKLPATLGQKAMAAALAVSIASDQSAIPVTGTFFQGTQPVSIAASVAVTGPLTDAQLRASAVPVSGTVTGNQGTANSVANGWPTKITDGTSTAAVKAASTAAVAADQALVVAISPNNPITVSNPSVGATGATTPTSATLAGGAATTAAPSLTTGQMSGLSLNLAGGLRTDGSGVTQPVSAASLPLPTGAATETTLGTRLADSTFTGRINTLGQKAMAASTPVTLASDQSTLPVSIAASVAVTGPLTDTQLRASAVPVTANAGTNLNTSALALDATLTGGTAKSRITDGTLNMALVNAAPGSDTGQVSIPVRVISSLAGGAGGTSSSYGSAFPAAGTAAGFSDGTNMVAGRVKAASTAAVAADPALVVAISPNNSVAVTGSVTANAGTNLNTSALALDATLSTMSGKLPATLGQKAMAAALAVSIASDQTAIPVTGTFFQATQPVSIAASVAVTGPLTDAQLRATAVPVSGTVTSNIGTTNGLALDATLTGGTAQSRITDGTNTAAVKAASTAAVAADKALVVVMSPNSSGPADATATGALGVLNATVQLTTSGLLGAGFQLAAGTLVGTLITEVSYDGGTTWIGTLFDDPVLGNKTATIVFGSANTATARSMVGVGGAGLIRVKVSAYTSGTANITLRASNLRDPSLMAGGQPGAATLPPVALQVGGTDGTNFRAIATTAAGAVVVSQVDGYKASYTALFLNLVPVGTTPTDIFTLIGSATKTVRVNRITITASQTTAAQRDVIILKRSTANTGGTSTTATVVPNDSANAAGTAVVRGYTANPTALGTLVGNVRARKVFIAGTAANSDEYIAEFGTRNNQSIVLRGVAETLAINLNSVASAGNLFNISIEWTEE